MRTGMQPGHHFSNTSQPVYLNKDMSLITIAWLVYLTPQHGGSSDLNWMRFHQMLEYRYFGQCYLMPIDCRRTERSLLRFAFSYSGHWFFLPCETSMLTVKVIASWSVKYSREVGAQDIALALSGCMV